MTVVSFKYLVFLGSQQTRSDILVLLFLVCAASGKKKDFATSCIALFYACQRHSDTATASVTSLVVGEWTTLTAEREKVSGF